MKPFIMSDPATAPTLDNARRAFAAGPPYVQAADILSVIAAEQYAKGIGTRPPLKFRSEVQRENFFSRARDAAIEAAATWQPRDRRAGFEAFKAHVFAAVDRELVKPTVPQGRATGGPLRVDEDGAPYKDRGSLVDALDIGDAVGSPPDQRADRQTLAAFQNQPGNKRIYDLATAVAPYTDNTPARYAQQLRKKNKGWSDAARAELEQEIRQAAELLHVFVVMWRPVPAMLDFEGASPVLVHHVLTGLASMPLPTQPPVGPELIGPFWESAAKRYPGLPGMLYRVGEKEDGALQPLARAYLLKLPAWYSMLSAALKEASEKQIISAETRERCAETLKEVVATRERWERSDVGRAALAVDARKLAQNRERKALKSKKSTRKP